MGRRTALRGWTRGLAVSDDFLFVGESATRKPGGAYGEAAGIVVVDRASWEVVERIPLPCREIYDLALVPPSIVEGVRTGFRTNPLRVGERDQADMFAEVGVRPARLWATGDPLPAEACRIDIEADVPDELPAGSMLNVECVVENRGSAILVSAPPRPVHVSYRWEPGDGVPEGVRSVLPEALPPGLRRISRFALATPDTPGDYVLRVTLVQEQVRWFDELDPTNAWSQPVRIRPVG